MGVVFSVYGKHLCFRKQGVYDTREGHEGRRMAESPEKKYSAAANRGIGLS